jgi:hypothetical protein
VAATNTHQQVEEGLDVVAKMERVDKKPGTDEPALTSRIVIVDCGELKGEFALLTVCMPIVPVRSARVRDPESRLPGGPPVGALTG